MNESIFIKLGISYRKDERMSAHTSFKIGGVADYFALPKNKDELKNLILAARKEGVKYTILGNGSNILCDDCGYRGIVISTLNMKEIKLIDSTKIFAEAGASLTAVCLFAKKHSLKGLEFAYGIPGSVGGALYMNAGAYGGEMKQVVESAISLDKNLNEKERGKDELSLSYRNSVYTNSNEIITGVVFSLGMGEPSEINEKMETLMAKRKASQPLEFGSAGSTFKRPVGYFAAALIDECGLKGLSVGDAEVSQKHAGFVINKGAATCADVLNLIDEIKRVVLDKKGVALETEVIYLR